MDGIDYKYIEGAIENLVDSVGVREEISGRRLISLAESKKTKECIKEIARCLKLPIEINLSYVSSGCADNKKDYFQSTHLVKTDWRGRGNEGITAQVLIPENLPMYGTDSLINFPISIRISENCSIHAATFIAVMAHELSHILLHSIRHKEKENEVYTDLTAMMLGFTRIMRTGRKVSVTERGLFSTQTVTTTYGYLSDDQFKFSSWQIETILIKHRAKAKKIRKEIEETKGALRSMVQLMSYFERYFKYLDEHRSQKMSKEDIHRMATFYQPGYSDEYELVRRSAESELTRMGEFTKGVHYYNDTVFVAMEKYRDRIGSLTERLAAKYIKLQGDVNFLKRYVSFRYRFQTFLMVTVLPRLW